MDHLQEKQARAKSALAQQMSVEIKLGMDMADDPANANLPDLTLRVTTIYSAWFGQTCRRCQDRFREGDQVRLCPECKTPYHDDEQYDLHCWQAQFGQGGICTEGGIDNFSEPSREIPRCTFSWSQPLPADTPATLSTFTETIPHASPDPVLVGQFVSGVKTTWRSFGELQSLKVEPGSPAVGRRCPWCRFRIRVGDWATACPCQSKCGTYFHQDVFHRLTCWNEWNGSTGHDYCPNTFAPYPVSLRGSQDDS